MSPTDGPAPLRVVVLGGEAELAEWRSILEGHGAQIGLAERSEDTPLRAGELVVATVPLRDARSVLESATTGGGGLVILAREGDGLHPGTGLIKAIARAKREWEMALDVLTDAVVIIDPAGKVLRANRAFATLVSRSFSELLSLPLADLLGTPAEGQPDPVRRVLDGEPDASGDVRFSVVAGIHQVHALAAAGSQGPRTVVVSLRDITALREQQQRQELSHRLADIGRLAAGVAHEISTPLASIALRAESLLRKAEDETLRSNAAFEVFPRYLKTIEEETFRCKRIIGGLLDFCRARRPEVMPIQVNALVETAVALIGDHARLKRVTLATQLDATLPHVALDAHQIREVVVALLLNALDASSAGGTVTLSTSRQGQDHLRIAVADRGEGIPPENMDRIFVPFFTTRPPGQAVGLGLSISDGIVREHGGEIFVESSLGAGTTVTVQLPLRGLAASGPTPRA